MSAPAEPVAMARRADEPGLPPNGSPAGGARPAPRSLATLSTRERRTVFGGVLVVLVALVVAYGVLPFARSWRDREARLDARVEQLARLRGLAGAEDRLTAAVREAERRLAARAQTPLRARTAAIAAATLQGRLQQLAQQAGVQVQRVDVAGETDLGDGAVDGAVDGALPATLPATLVVLGDVHGLAALLAALQGGPTLLEVASLAAQTTPGPRGEPLLSITVGVRAPWIADGGESGLASGGGTVGAAASGGVP